MHAVRRRVLILVENLPVPFDRRVWQEACALRDGGYDVTVICPRMRGHTQAEEVLDGIQIYRHWIAAEARTPFGFLLEYASALLGEFWHAWKAMSRHGRFDVIHLCNPPDLLFLVALPLKLLFGTRVVFDVHDLCPEMFEAKFGARGSQSGRAAPHPDPLPASCPPRASETRRGEREIVFQPPQDRIPSPPPTGGDADSDSLRGRGRVRGESDTCGRKFPLLSMHGLLYRAVRLAERATLALADVVIATNQSVLAAVTRRGHLQADSAFVVRTAPNALDTAAPRDEALKQGKTHLVGYIGVMGSADGVEYLLKAAHHLIQAQKRTDVHFLLMGSGPEYDALLSLRDELGLTAQVSMPGRVSDAFLCSALQTIDLGIACDPINAYNDHCTMNKVLEYMAFAKPVVMFGTMEGRHSAGEAGTYVMENNAVKLAEAISSLLDDPTRRQQMGRAGFDRLTTELNWQKSTASLHAAYERALR